MKRLGFTGTQEGCTPLQLSALKAKLEQLLDDGYNWMHNGDCLGADLQAAVEFYALGGAIHLHPPGINTKRAFFQGIDTASHPKPYRERNQDIVDASEILVACPKSMSEELRSGTWMTIRMARKQGKSIIIIWPDGTVSNEPNSLAKT